MNGFYSLILNAVTLRPSSIQSCGNSQGDLEHTVPLFIALIRELAIISRQLEIDTLVVLEAAGTKKNFMPFRCRLARTFVAAASRKTSSIFFMPVSTTGWTRWLPTRNRC